MKLNFLKRAGQILEDLSPDCKEAVRCKSQEMEGQLHFRARIGLRIHLWLCKWCRRYSRQLEFLRIAARSENPDLTRLPGLSAEARARIVENLEKLSKDAK